MSIYDDVKTERHRQDLKWGDRSIPENALTPSVWALILGEEYGEFCQAALGVKDGGLADSAAMRKEAIQVAAVAVAIVEAIDRKALATAILVPPEEP